MSAILEDIADNVVSKLQPKLEELTTASEQKLIKILGEYIRDCVSPEIEQEISLQLACHTKMLKDHLVSVIDEYLHQQDKEMKAEIGEYLRRLSVEVSA